MEKYTPVKLTPETPSLSAYLTLVNEISEGGGTSIGEHVTFLHDLAISPVCRSSTPPPQLSYNGTAGTIDITTIDGHRSRKADSPRELIEARGKIRQAIKEWDAEICDFETVSRYWLYLRHGSAALTPLYSYR